MKRIRAEVGDGRARQAALADHAPRRFGPGEAVLDNMGVSDARRRAPVAVLQPPRSARPPALRSEVRVLNRSDLPVADPRAANRARLAQAA